MDILHADKYRQTTDGIEMQLRASLNKENLTLKHEPSTVAYEIRQIGGKNWLIRTQRQGSDAWSELVAMDVITITPDILRVLPSLTTWKKVSDSLVMNVLFAGTNESPMRVNCILK